MLWQTMHRNDINKENGKKEKWSLDIDKYKTIIKKISIDKWILIGIAGLVLALCSDSCSGDGDSESEGGLLGIGAQSSDDNNTDNQANNSANGAYSGTGSSLDFDLEVYTDSLESELEEMLMAVEGAGAVKVMITLKSTATKEILMEEPYSESSIIESDSEGGSRDALEVSRDQRVIYQENSDGDVVPYVLTEIYPEVEGVAVIAQGGDSATVKEKISSIIKALFGIEINKIAVGKMK